MRSEEAGCKTGPDEAELPVVVMRGGTSKGVYLHAHDLPSSAAERDAVLLRRRGSSDSIQIDGLGGARPTTFKVAIISRSERPDADVDYLFAQVDIDQPIVGYRGNCGNISAEVGPFAVDEGPVQALGDGPRCASTTSTRTRCSSRAFRSRTARP